MTVRRDVTELDKLGFLQRVHGEKYCLHSIRVKKKQKSTGEYFGVSVPQRWLQMCSQSTTTEAGTDIEA